MIDLARLARGDDAYRHGIVRKGFPDERLDDIVAMHRTAHELQTAVEAKRATQKASSREVAQATGAVRERRIAEAAALKEDLAALEAKCDWWRARLRTESLAVPNPADASVPDGGEDDGVTLRSVGEPGPAAALDHAGLAQALGFVETHQAAAASGSRFASLMGEAVLLEVALVQWTLGRLVAEGFTPVAPPVLVREEAMVEAGFFPTDRHQVYEVDGGELFLVGTSEIPLAALHRGERLDAAALPARYAGVSTCFRREAGTHGKDTTGIFRVHQFDKVEMFAYAHPDESDAEHERLVAIQESIVGGLGLPYRVVSIAAGDLGAAAASKIDLEVWLPSEGRYRELTSCSNYRDYSARRLGTRVKTDGGSTFVHTLNGTACAVGRTLVFLWEHGQRGDGAFVVPEVLAPLCGFEVVEPRA